MLLLTTIYKVIWFLLPAALANMGAAISGKIFPQFSYPMDFNLTYKNKRILGDHKTFRGLLLGLFVGMATYFYQVYLIEGNFVLKEITLDNFETKYMLGILLPLGALIGDAIKSFFKRQLNIESGTAWFPFDQIDWILGAFLFSYFVVRLDFYFVLVAIVLGMILHVLVKWIGYMIGLQEEKF